MLQLPDLPAGEESWEILQRHFLYVEYCHFSFSFNVHFSLTCVLDIVIAVILLESHLRASVLVLDWRLLGLKGPGNLARDGSLRHRELAWRAQSGPGGESAGAEDREQRGRVTSRTSWDRGWRRQEARAEAGLGAAMAEVGVGGTHRHSGGRVAK